MRTLTTTIATLGFLLSSAGSGSAQVTRSTVLELDATELLRLYVAGEREGDVPESTIAFMELNRRISSGTPEEHRDLHAAMLSLLEATEPVPREQNPELTGLLINALRLATDRPSLGVHILNVATEWFEDPEDPRLSRFLLAMNRSPESMHPSLMNRVAALIRRSDLEGWTMQVAVSAMGGFGPPGLQRLRTLESDESVPDATVRWIRYFLSTSGG